MRHLLPLRPALLAALTFTAPLAIGAEKKKTEGALEVSGGVRLSGAASSTGTDSSETSDPRTDGLGKAIKEMEASIMASMKKFQDAGRPKEEQLKEFDTMLAQYDNAMQITAEGGKLDQSIDAAISAQRERMGRYQKLVGEPTIDINIRDRYKKFIDQGKQRQEQILQQRDRVRATRNELMNLRMQVNHQKQFYADLYAEGQLEEAKASLIAVQQSMEKVAAAVARLGEINANITGAKTQN